MSSDLGRVNFLRKSSCRLKVATAKRRRTPSRTCTAWRRRPKRTRSGRTRRRCRRTRSPSRRRVCRWGAPLPTCRPLPDMGCTGRPELSVPHHWSCLLSPTTGAACQASRSLFSGSRTKLEFCSLYPASTWAKATNMHCRRRRSTWRRRRRRSWCRSTTPRRCSCRRY